MKRYQLGFSLVELLVVVSIISILATALIISQKGGSAESRDIERRADLQNLQTAVELYKSENGRYPSGCNAANAWSGQVGTNFECGDGTGIYIQGIAEYMPTLPKDPKLNGADSGYIYSTNSEGSVYKIMALNTVESETVDINNEFKSCPISFYGDVSCPHPFETTIRCDFAMCDKLYTSNNFNGTTNKPNECDPSHSQFQNSYAVWGGWAKSVNYRPDTSQYIVNAERLTEAIVCKI